MLFDLCHCAEWIAEVQQGLQQGQADERGLETHFVGQGAPEQAAESIAKSTDASNQGLQYLSGVEKAFSMLLQWEQAGRVVGRE